MDGHIKAKRKINCSSDVTRPTATFHCQPTRKIVLIYEFGTATRNFAVSDK
jgi:hypothetical protein